MKEERKQNKAFSRTNTVISFIKKNILVIAGVVLFVLVLFKFVKPMYDTSQRLDNLLSAPGRFFSGIGSSISNGAEWISSSITSAFGNVFHK